jgi:hypothetical protein
MGHSLKEHFIEFNETHILDDDNVRVVGVKEKKKSQKEVEYC